MGERNSIRLTESLKEQRVVGRINKVNPHRTVTRTIEVEAQVRHVNHGETMVVRTWAFLQASSDLPPAAVLLARLPSHPLKKGRARTIVRHLLLIFS
jgi:hypothetical protein